MPTLFDDDTAVGFVRVAVERGVDRYPDGLVYAVPDGEPELATVAPGDRVIVPLGRGDTPTGGYVIERLETPPPGLDRDRLKPLASRDPHAPALPGELLDLAAWISRYYCTPIGMTLAGVMPAAVKRHVGMVRRTLVDLGRELAEGERITRTQRRVIEVLATLPASGRPIDIRRAVERAELGTSGPIKRLIERGLLRATVRTTVEAAWAEQAVDSSVPRTLTDAQQSVIEALDASLAAGFSTHLLYGVTGSGKTEVYIRLLERVVSAGQVGILLVPEIALTPQTGGRLIGRFPDRRVAVLHSGLTAAQRHQQWSLISDGTADIVLGARSAVFAPVADGRLGLVIVDEEHDGSYKQDQAPRYHGRDVAIRRAQIASCPVLLGSATPSLESWYNATERHRCTLHRLPARVPGLTVPRVRIVDLAEELRHRPRDNRIHLLGPTLENAIRTTLQGEGSVLLLLNRRGFASYIACPDHRCGWMMGCEQCDVSMVYHVDRRLPTGGFVRCHHCEAEQRLPETCPTCGRRISKFGPGTQRVEAELLRSFPGLIETDTLVRVDSDTMRGARDFHRVLGRFASGEVRVLLGTQMIAKGLDFPVVRLVGVVNADTALSLPDFRATERTFQLVNQVSGRCGRGAAAGLVIVQTFQPAAAVIRLAAADDYVSFAEAEVAERKAVGQPPVTRMARIVVRDEDLRLCRQTIEVLAERLRSVIEEDAIRLDGPAPCPIDRIAGRYRRQIDLTAQTAPALLGLLATARERGWLEPGARMAIDVDPISML